MKLYKIICPQNPCLEDNVWLSKEKATDSIACLSYGLFNISQSCKDLEELKTNSKLQYLDGTLDYYLNCLKTTKIVELEVVSTSESSAIKDILEATFILHLQEKYDRVLSDSY